MTPLTHLRIFSALLLGLFSHLSQAQDVSLLQSQLRVYMADMMSWGEVSALTLYEDDTAELVLEAVDPDGKPLADQPIKLRSDAGNGLLPGALRTDEKGQLRLRVHGSVVGQDNLKLQAGPAAGTVAVLVSKGAGEKKTYPKAPKLEQRDDVINWKTLARIKVEMDGVNPRVLFSRKVRELHGQEVKLQGFMMPLDTSEFQRHFILSANPPSCFFCMPGTAAGLVEIESLDDVKFGFEPVVLSGLFIVVNPEDSDSGLYYRLTDARLEKP